MYLPLTLERKFIALASAIIMICSFVANIVIVNIYRNQLFSEAERRAHLLAESTAISFTNTLLYQELDSVEQGGLLDSYIGDLVSDSIAAVAGVTVYDKTGRVLASDNYQRFSEKLDSKTVEQWSNLVHAQIIEVQYENSFEVHFPLQIRGKHFGTLRMQFSRQTEIIQVAEFKRWMLIATAGFAIFGILLAFIVARTLATPIKRLAGEMGKVEDPTYVTGLVRNRVDEIGDLQRGFIEMLTRLKAAADEKERQQKALIQTEKLASVGTLVSGLAHEINNPLAGIRNCLRRIITRPEDASQTEKYAKLMDKALFRIEKIVKDLLNFSRKRDLVLQKVNVNDCISTACNLIDLKMTKHRAKFSLKLARDLPRIVGDPQHLEQVLVNLLLNAVDATGEEGDITVKSKCQDSRVVIEIADTGKGIAPELQHKIFDPFFTTKPVGQGTGLGLSVSKAIVEEHDGRIEVSSGAKGTIFRLIFPVADTPNSVIKNQHQVAAAILAGGKSKRMQQNKALMTFDGKPMIQHAVECVRSQVKEVMIISDQVDAYRFLHLPVFPDAVTSCGPLAGIYTALRHSKQNHCLVVACDLPFLSPQLIGFLCENSAPYDVLAFESESGVEPLCAVYSKACLPNIETQIQNQKYKVSDFYDKVKTRIVRLEPRLIFYDQNAFFNVNTPDELKKARELLVPTSANVRKTKELEGFDTTISREPDRK